MKNLLPGFSNVFILQNTARIFRQLWVTETCPRAMLWSKCVASLATRVGYARATAGVFILHCNQVWSRFSAVAPSYVYFAESPALKPGPDRTCWNCVPLATPRSPLDRPLRNNNICEENVFIASFSLSSGDETFVPEDR